MASLIDLFINHMAAEDKQPDTLTQYRGVLQRFEQWLQQAHSLSLTAADVGSITGLHLSEYYQILHSNARAVSTRNNYTTIIKSFFSFLKKTHVIRKNPADVLRSVKEKGDKSEEDDRSYTAEQLGILLNSLQVEQPTLNNYRDLAIVALILGTGLRASEVCGLNVSDAEGIKSGMIRCKRKGGANEKVYVASFVYPHVERYLLMRRKPQPDEPLFTSQKKQRATRNMIWRMLSTKQEKLGLPTGVHILRHTFLSAVDHTPGGAALARDLAGHSSVSITNTYLHASEAECKEGVNKVGYASLLCS